MVCLSVTQLEGVATMERVRVVHLLFATGIPESVYRKKVILSSLTCGDHRYVLISMIGMIIRPPSSTFVRSVP